jgi:hypothetical protein
MQAWALPLMENIAQFRKSRGTCEWSDKHKKCVGSASLYFQLQLNAVELLSVPTDTEIKE